MKLTNSFCSFLFLCILNIIWVPALFADNNAQPWDEQEAERDAREEMTNDERSAQEEMSSSISGRVTSIDMDGKFLFLLPTDQVEDEEEEEDDDDVPQAYHFKSDTPITGLDSLSEISPGDYLTLDYYAFRNKNRIREVIFDKHGENENNASKTKESSPGILIG